MRTWAISVCASCPTCREDRPPHRPSAAARRRRERAALRAPSTRVAIVMDQNLQVSLAQFGANRNTRLGAAAGEVLAESAPVQVDAGSKFCRLLWDRINALFGR